VSLCLLCAAMMLCIQAVIQLCLVLQLHLWFCAVHTAMQ